MAKRASAICNRLRVGPMKRLYKYYTPEAVNFAGGVPMDSSFPMRKMEVVLSTNDRINLAVGAGLSLNYQRGDGIPDLRDWVNAHLSNLHSPVNKFGSCLTIGSTDAYAKVLTLLDGDSVIFDEYAYGTAVSACRTYGRTGIGVKMDGNGMVPEDLRTQTLAAREKGLNPDIVYLVPVAQNPTGISMSPSRKEEIYRVCQELDLFIVEDDAYFYLYHGKDSGISDPFDDAKLPGLKGLPRSFFSMDTDGRVIRMDSLSKFVCPGMRLGWIAAPVELTDKYQLLQEMTSQFPSGLSQSAFAAIVKAWGEERLHTHLQQIQGHYLKQRNAMCSALTQFLNPQDVQFELPDGGMFVFLKFRPGFIKIPSDEMFKVLAANGVIVVPGNDFMVSRIVSSDSPSGATVRLSYAATQPGQIHEGVQRLARGLELLSKMTSDTAA